LSVSKEGVGPSEFGSNTSTVALDITFFVLTCVANIASPGSFRRFLRFLPPARRVYDLQEVEAFFRKEEKP